jgi:hypothetical protein
MGYKAGRIGYATPNATVCSSMHVAFSSPHQGMALPTGCPVRIQLLPNAAQSSTHATPALAPPRVWALVLHAIAQREAAATRWGRRAWSSASLGRRRGAGGVKVANSSLLLFSSRHQKRKEEGHREAGNGRRGRRMRARWRTPLLHTGRLRRLPTSTSLP